MKMSEAASRCVLTFFGSGRFPWASGTVGSLAALLVGWGAWSNCDDAVRPYLFPLMGCIASAGCVLLGKQIEQLYRDKDPSAVVIDEVAGQWFALSVLPWLPAAAVAGWTPWLLAFFLFRVFDVLKPLGIRRLESLPRGWGVLLDDVAAGLVVVPILLLGYRYMLGS